MLLCKFGQNPFICSEDIASENLIWSVFMGWWPWKWGQGHQNLINSFTPPNHVSMQVWSKSIHWFKRYRVGKKLRGRDPHQKQYVPHLRLGGHNQIDSLKLKGIEIDIAWTPSHANIAGKETADNLAKEAAKDAESTDENIDRMVTTQDVKTAAKTSCLKKWQRRWGLTNSGRDLYSYKKKKKKKKKTCRGEMK